MVATIDDALQRNSKTGTFRFYSASNLANDRSENLKWVAIRSFFIRMSYLKLLYRQGFRHRQGPERQEGPS